MSDGHTDSQKAADAATAAFEARNKSKIAAEEAAAKKQAAQPPKNLGECFERARNFLQAKKALLGNHDHVEQEQAEYDEIIAVVALGEATLKRDLGRINHGSAALFTALQQISPWEPNEKRDFFDEVLYGTGRVSNQYAQLRQLLVHVSKSIAGFFKEADPKLPEDLKVQAKALAKGIHNDIVKTFGGFTETVNVETTPVAEPEKIVTA